MERLVLIEIAPGKLGILHFETERGEHKPQLPPMSTFIFNSAVKFISDAGGSQRRRDGGALP
jgi:hypothetical protein